MNNKEIQRKRRHIRIRSIVIGTEKRPRIVVFRSNLRTYVQVVNDDNGKIKFGFCTDNDPKSKKTAMEKCSELGKRLANELKKNKIDSIVFDRNGYKYHGKVKAIAEAIREGGINF